MIYLKLMRFFTSCFFACNLWSLVSSRIFAFYDKDLMELHSSVGVGGGGEWKKVLHAIILTTCWCIWRARNELVHNAKKVEPKILLGEIKSLLFLWITNRSKSIDVRIKYAQHKSYLELIK
ncbi:hypothetical protein R6Q59_036657 [Mikania micrantha]